MLAGRGRGKIRAPRRGLNVDEVDFDAVWGTLSSSFREIHTQNASRLSFEELYRNAYKLVLKKKGEQLYESVQQFEREWLSSEVRRRVVDQLKSVTFAEQGDILAATVNERRVAGERILRALKDAWEDHQLCMAMLTDVLMYMDRVYCTDYKRPSIYTAAMTLFRDYVLRSPLGQGDSTMLLVLSKIILDQIKMERDGDVIDKHLIRSCVYMLEGLYDANTEIDDAKLYITTFEVSYLEASRTFYKFEGETLLREMDAGTYCKHVRRRLIEERDRCNSTLADCTAPKIEQVVQEELVKHKLKEIIDMDSGVCHMINNDYTEELGLVYELNAMVDPRKLDLIKAVQKRILEMGTEVNNAATAASEGKQPANDDATGDGAGENPDGADGKEKAKNNTDKVINQQTAAALKWVEDVLALKDKFDIFWKTSFKSDQAVQTALTRSFSDFINALTRSSEFISLFIDRNMKEGLKGKTETEVDMVLEKAITLLRYIQDKDMFERYYKKHLCRRLLMNKSVSTDIEKQMISRMKIELGNNFTSKLEAMFKDMSLSTDLTAGFKQYVERLGDADPKRIDLSVSILTMTTWPLDSITASSQNESEVRAKCILPSAIERIKKSFEQYYADKHSGRVLTWQANMGTADVRAHFPVKGRKYELNVSTYAMCILLLFNDLEKGAALTFEEIQAKTNIPAGDLGRNLQSLAVVAKTRVLVKEPMSRDVKPTDRFSVNDNFQSKFFKIKVGVVSQGNRIEGERERRETEQRNNDSRRYQIQAAIVRIMKQRKQLTHSQLITETLTLLAAQFKPDIALIKPCIESLIDREYLKRLDEASVMTYEYVA